MPTIISKSTRDTVNLGFRLAKKSKGGQIYALVGDLGGGKTYFTKGFAKGLGLRHKIASPSFVMMKVYKLKKRGVKFFCHVDAYRLKTLRDIPEIGLLEYLGRKDTVVVIEWADRLKGIIKQYPKITLNFYFIDQNTRKIVLTKKSPSKR